MAGNTILSSDDNTLTVREGLFAASTANVSVGNNHAALRDALRIRLVNLNVNHLGDGSAAPAGNEVEVDFDNLRLNVAAIASAPEPVSFGLMMLGSSSGWRSTAAATTQTTDFTMSALAATRSS